VLKAFQEGADGVIIAGCHIPADCHYTSGNFKALARYETFQPLLDELGIERERLQLHWISASEGEKFARVMNEFSETIRRLGPLDLDKVRGRCPLKTGRMDAANTDAANREPGIRECPVIRKAQEFAACEAASSGMVDLAARRLWPAEERRMEPSIVYSAEKCIRCGSCVETCDLQGVKALHLDPHQGVVVDESLCVRCGQCTLSCPLAFPDKAVRQVTDLMDCRLCPFARPVGAVSEQDDVGKVLAALQDPRQYVVVEVAPSIRSTIGEAFGIEDGSVVTKKLYTALRQAGFDRVWDTNFSADLTIMEEGSELISRLQPLLAAGAGSALPLPQFTSCCPAWVRFVEINYPSLIPHLSSAKSPQQMFGAVAKTYAAQQLGVDPANLFVVSLMPCTAKKYERSRLEMGDAAHFWAGQGQAGAYPDVDAVLTTREISRLLKLLQIDLAAQPESGPDSLLGEYTGAATIFGRTGGVMTAALRTAYELVAGEEIPDLDLVAFGAYQGIKTAEVSVSGQPIKVAVAFGLQNARLICESILAGGEFAGYQFIEIMTCPGGCVGGGGQIISTNRKKTKTRAGGLDSDDKSQPLRKSHENAEIREIYERFLGEPGSSRAHHLLHTAYTGRSTAKEDCKP
jgi:iron-only hydrogenase group A